jgi:hypothetical protein
VSHTACGRPSRSPIVAALAAMVMSAAALTPAAASAEPVKVTFTVAGAPSDPLNAGVVASGSFFFDESMIAPGEVLFAPDGLNALALAFQWDGTSWTVNNADVVLLGFADDGTLNEWAWGGFRAAFNGLDSNVFPDVLMAEPGSNFLYTDARTRIPGSLGAFEGKVLTWEVTREAAPIPEPVPLILLGGGLGCVAAWRRRACLSLPVPF